MKYQNFYKLFFIYLFFLISLIIGFFLNEDLGGGSKYDYGIHKETIRLLFLDSNLFGLLNYGDDEISTNTHSPVFMILLKYLTLNNEIFGRIIYLILSSSIVIFFYKSIKIKYKLDYCYLFVLSNFFLLSPYYRSYSIWPGDETLSILFFCISIFFYLKIKFAKEEKNIKSYIFFNVFFLAISSYLRPIYCIFSIFYFYSFFFDKKLDVKTLFFYFFVNLILAFPAVYYVFVLDIKFFLARVKEFNFIDSFALFYLTIFFYLTPFIYLNFKNLIKSKIDLFELSLLILSILAVIFFFDYKILSGGGFFYQLSLLFFDNSILVYILFPVSFYFVNRLLYIKKFNNLVLIILLIFLELDDQFFIESYDPLFFLLFFLVFKSKYLEGFFKNLKEGVMVLFVFQLTLLTIKFIQQNLL